MKKRFLITYLFISSILLILMTLSQYSTALIRDKTLNMLTPVWTSLLNIKHLLSHPTQSSPLTSFSKEEENLNLQTENQILLNELTYLKQALKQQLQIHDQLSLISTVNSEKAKELSEVSKSSAERLSKQLQFIFKGLPARVLFRTLDTWNSSLWVNVGEATNKQFETKIVAKNSPVVVGRVIIGVIDYVGEHQSHVKLLSDPHLTPSVRAARGGEQEFLAFQSLNELLPLLGESKFLSLSEEEQQQMHTIIRKLSSQLKPLSQSTYLGKGELTGAPLFYRRSHMYNLIGTGFNYDFDDDEGEARDLRTGIPIAGKSDIALPIIQVDDVLVTTGMDGLFPPGFQVAKIDKINPLKEGDYYYTIEAIPIVSPLQNLDLVFVLPPYTQETLKHTEG